MNPSASHPTSPLAMIKSIWSHRTLIKQLTKREISGRYRGSFLGLAWSFFTPLLMLSIYTFIFTFVFKARWDMTEQENQTEFAIILFAGLIIHSLLAEVISRAPDQILINANYVKKVVFPLEILSVVNVLTALFHSVINYSVLLFAMAFFSILPSSTAVLAPLTVLPIVPMLLGLSWILSSLGVYIRDLAQFVGFIVTALLFLAPIFYPLTTLPLEYQQVILFNPITVPIIETREVLLFDSLPNLITITYYSICSFSTCFFGYWWFQKSRKGFSDVV